MTSIFLHGNPAHLLLNCIALFFFGRALESEVSSKALILIFFLGGIVGNLFVLFAYPASQIVVGASGAVFAVMGTGILLAPMDLVFYPAPVPVPLALIGIVIAISETMAFIAGPADNIAHAAHLGGLVAGMLFGLREGESKKGLIIIAVMFVIILLMPNIWSVLNEISYLNILTSQLGGL